MFEEYKRRKEEEEKEIKEIFYSNSDILDFEEKKNVN